MHVQFAFGRMDIGPQTQEWADRLNPLIGVLSGLALAMGLWALYQAPDQVPLVMLGMVLIEALASSVCIYLNLRQIPQGDDLTPAVKAARLEGCIVRWWPFELALLSLALLLYLHRS